MYIVCLINSRYRIFLNHIEMYGLYKEKCKFFLQIIYTEVICTATENINFHHWREKFYPIFKVLNVVYLLLLNFYNSQNVFIISKFSYVRTKRPLHNAFNCFQMKVVYLAKCCHDKHITPTLAVLGMKSRAVWEARLVVKSFVLYFLPVGSCNTISGGLVCHATRKVVSFPTLLSTVTVFFSWW